jgi:hypothetical protein
MLHLRAIAVRQLVVRPDDGPAWELAKYFVAQGSAWALTTASHPRLHLPMDAINGLTRKLLPEGHVLRTLIEPHCYLSLCVNYAVLYHPMSVARNSQKHPYATFPARGREQIRLFKISHLGHRDLAAWPAYRYPLEIPEVIGPYGRFLKAYEGVIARHVERSLAGIEPADPHVLKWAEELSRQLPGFPGPIAISRPGVLASAVTTFVASVSLHHSSDHANYGASDPFKTPMRLRLPPPTSRNMAAFKRSELCTRRDLFRQLLAHEMFFKVHTVKPLVQVEYGFDTLALRENAKRFVDELRACRPGTRQYVPLELIGTSIQS